MPDQTITRFAPSPTGFLHIGGARTALFNWLFAKARGGKMLLRIEDTDRARSSDEAIAAILEGLTWLGLDWEGAPVSQFARADRHREIAEQLIAAGQAYRCSCTPDEIAAMRERARADGRPAVYDGTCRENAPGDVPTEMTAIRFKAPRTGETIIDDKVQGRIAIGNDTLDDLVILRSDGTPTYMLAVVVDDHDMAVSHVIRGDDHLTNAARQTQIYSALGWPAPVFAHIPLIHGPDGAKLSKRHGALGIEAYREMGYLPQAMRNYLARLGWSHGDDEIMSDEEMIGWFTLEGVNKSAARFDFAKLESLNHHYLREMPEAELAGLLLDFIARFTPDGVTPPADPVLAAQRLMIALPGLKERARTLAQMARAAQFLFAERPLSLDARAQKLLHADAIDLLAKVVPLLEETTGWTAQSLETTLKDFVNIQGVKLGDLAQPLRAALTGTTTSPGIFDVIAALGKDEAISRIRDQAPTGS